LYHSTGFFLSAFFGGPMGAVIYGLANSRLLGRLRQDSPVLLALLAATYLLAFELHRNGLLAGFGSWLGMTPRSTQVLLIRALGLGCFGAIYFMHRKFFRSAQVSAADPLPGWMPGIVAVVLGILANSAYTLWILKHP
jgi:hypothetical protein